MVAAAALLALLALLGIRVAASRAPIPGRLGVRDGRLAPCPPTPNCVSTQATDPEHSIAPIRYEGDVATAKERLRAAIDHLGQNRIVTDRPEYIHAEFRIRGFGFVDDVEFYFAPDAPVIHFRSASRLGRGDLGVNRRRMEAVRGAFERTQTSE